MLSSVSFGGVVMDIDRVMHMVASKDGDINKRNAFIQAAGSRLSAMEHLVPEQLFKTETESPQGVSAVKALQIAMQEGQKIYHLTQTNTAQLANINIAPQAKSEIANALNAGKEITLHEKPIQAFGFSGSGYIILDPETGTGAYKISTGENGSKTALKGAKGFQIAAVIFRFLNDGVNATSLRRVSTALSFVASIGNIFERCANLIDELWMITLIMIATLMSILISMALSGFGIFAWVILSAILGAIRTKIMITLMTWSGCRSS